MELKQNKNKIKVTETDVYLDPNDMTILEGSYRRQDSITLDIIIGLNHNNEIIEVKYSINDHSTSDDFTVLETSKDGLYKIIHYIIPTLSWTDRSNLDNIIFYYDNKLYLRANGSDEEIGIEDILENENENENDEKAIFMIYFIKKCFGEIVKKILSAKSECNTRALVVLKEQRELIWMLINIIQYSLEFGNLLEAQLYIEKFFKCNTICNKPISNITNYDCGCK